MTDTTRSRNVCYACKVRKTACDKALPACGFCASRRLLCRYDISASLKSPGRRRYNPGRHFVPLQLQSPSPPLNVVPPKAKSVTPQLLSPGSQQGHIPPLHHSSLSGFLQQSVEESLNQLIQHFAEITELTCDGIVDHYFQVFHRWLPIGSADSIRKEASRYREEERLPPADFTVFLLAMLLMILPTVSPSTRPPRTSQALLYRATKSAFSQAQASIGTSLRLVQAALLITQREYVCVRPEAAYISMMTCIGLARVEEMRITSVSTTRGAQKTNGSRMEEMEKKDLAWAIAILER